MLPITLETEPEESWLSFLKRHSRAYDLPLREVARAVGTLRPSGRKFLPDFMMEPPALLQRAWGGDLERLDAMFHSRFQHVYGDDWGEVGIQEYSQREWLHLLHSPICPECLLQGAGAWRVTWHVPFIFMCQEHGKLLSHECPGCSREHSFGWRDGSNSPLFLKYVADTRTCMNPGDSELQASDVRSKRPCRFDLTVVPSIPVTDARLLDAQMQIVRVLNGEVPAYSFGAEVTQREWFYDLRTLVAYLTYAAPGSLASGYPAPLSEAWSEMCEKRDAAVIDRQSKKAKGAKAHTFKTAPPPPVMAIAVCHALPLMSLGKDEAVSAVRDMNDFAVTSEAARTRRITWRDANSRSFALVAHSAALADRLVQAFLSGHPERGDAAKCDPPPPVPGYIIERRLPRFAQALEPGNVLLGFDLMVRYFREPDARRWADVTLSTDPPSIVSSVRRLITIAGKVGEARALGEFIADYSLARVPTDPSPVSPEPEPTKLDFRHLPNYLPWRHFAAHFAGVFEELSLGSYLARSTAAFLLAKAGTGLPEAEVMERLRYPDETIRDRIQRTVVRIRGRQLTESVSARALDLLSELCQREAPVDYVERAREYRSLMVLPANDWAVVVANSGTAHGRVGAHGSYAAALVWAELTGNGWKEAPAVRERSGKLESTIEAVRRFEHDMTPLLKEELLRYVDFLDGGGSLGHYFPDSPSHSARVQPFEIPQLCWQGVYDEHFQRYFSHLNVSERTARAVCSMALLARVVDAPLSRLGELLALDTTFVAAGIERARLLVTSGPNSENFDRSVQEALLEYSRKTPRPNYTARRHALNTLTEVPEEDWVRICSDVGVGLGRPSGRNVYGAMRLWASLTEGDPFHSPAFKKMLESRRKDYLVAVYKSMSHSVFPPMQASLEQYGMEIIHSKQA